MRAQTLESLPDSHNTESELDQSYYSEICDSLVQSFTSNDSMKSVVTEKKIRPEISDQLEKCISKSLKYNEPLTSMQSTLQIMNQVPGSRFQLPQTKYKIRQTIRSSFDIEMHYECQRCGLYTGISKSLVKTTQIYCTHCNHTILKTAYNFFIYIPLKQQLVESIRKNWASIVNFKQTKRDEHFISDAHDGHIIKKKTKQSFQNHSTFH